jgi:4-alpha-glucanotransferase
MAEVSRPRRAGLLLHPTSLPGPFGIGDLGPRAETFLHWAAAAGQSVWQVLPLGPPVYRGTPYGSLSSFAGNPLLISPERLFEDGLLTRSEIAGNSLDPARVDFAKIDGVKGALTWRAWQRLRSAPSSLHAELQAFESEQAGWLEDWALFAAIKSQQGGRPWNAWPEELARREPRALVHARGQLREEIAYQRFLQFLFNRQWQHLRRMAGRLGIAILGDLPIYAAFDSADVWLEPHLFDLDLQRLAPRHVAGVPPDYFSPDGQLWGQPLYRWERMAADSFRWWRRRLRASLRWADSVRIDHFRGFAAYWQVPFGHRNAIHGSWQPGPGRALFEVLRADLGGSLPVVAEDLGEITEDVHALRQAFGLPGMRVLQFGFGPEPGLHTPHRHVVDSVVYTGTHDNDTAIGWYRSLSKADQTRFHAYTGSPTREVHWTLIRTAYASCAELAVVPIQDVLGLGTRARMNTPGKSEGNWAWRLPPGKATGRHAARLAKLVALFERSPSR